MAWEIWQCYDVTWLQNQWMWQVCLYVYNMLIVGSDDKIITSTKNMLNSRFDMKDMGLADVILGIKS